MGLKHVGKTVIQEKHLATCHCGVVQMELTLPDGIVDPRRCDCSICRRKGAIVASVPLSGIRIFEGQDKLTLYQFNTMTAKHYFCSICGIYTHHQRRSQPDLYGYNVGCLVGVNPFEIQEITLYDGVNHPADRSVEEQDEPEEDPKKSDLVVDSGAFKKMFNDHGAIMYIVDLSTFTIIDANQAALDFYGFDRQTMLTKRIPDLNTTPEAEIRAEIKKAVAENRTYYVFKHRLSDGTIRDVEIYANPISIQGKDYAFSVVHDITEHKKVEDERNRLIDDLQTSLNEIKTLRGIIPICSYCKKVRDDQGFWNQVDVYIREHSEADFSHSLCPECVHEHYSDIFKKE